MRKSEKKAKLRMGGGSRERDVEKRVLRREKKRTMKESRFLGTRRAQIQFGESLMVVVILVFILIIGIVFYYKASAGSITKEIQYREDVGAVTLAKNVLALPEVQCSRLAAHGNCIDEYKLRALASLIQGAQALSVIREQYESRFGRATIKLHVLGEQDDILLYEKKPNINLTVTPQFIFTTIYNPFTRTQHLAYLNVTRYTRGGAS